MCALTPLLATHGIVGLIRKLAGMPDRNDPDGVTNDAVEETIQLNGHFPMRKGGELRDNMPGLRILAKLDDGLLSASLKSGCC